MFELRDKAWALIGVMVILIGISYYGYTKLRYREWAEIEATTTDSDCHVIRSRGSSRTVCHVEVDYVYKDEEYTVIWPGHSMTYGHASILVNPSDPSQSTEPANHLLWAYILVVSGIGCIIVQIKLWFDSGRRREL